jgi:16S rRNA (cytidine1402-2'-O)-methyltransferase
MGILYLVATPIGNLEDISARGLRVLGQVGLIAAEDTRHTGKLLKHFNIATPMTSYHEHNKLVKLDHVTNALKQGDVALVSDAGTPALNDPGYELVRAVLAAGYEVSPIPGPSAPIAALIASGLPTDKFLYLGYLPRKTNERRQILMEIHQFTFTLIFLESPHRLLDSLVDLQEVLGNRQMCAARELTKLYEEFFRGRIDRAYQFFQSQPPRGEITLVIAGASPNLERWTETELMNAIQDSVSKGNSASAIAAQFASQSGWPRREIYKLAVKEKREHGPG